MQKIVKKSAAPCTAMYQALPCAAGHALSQERSLRVSTVLVRGPGPAVRVSDPAIKLCLQVRMQSPRCCRISGHSPIVQLGPAVRKSASAAAVHELSESLPCA